MYRKQMFTHLIMNGTSKINSATSVSYGVQCPPKFNFWIFLVFLAFDVVVLQFVPTSAIEHSSFQFLYSNCRFDIVCFTSQLCSLKDSTFKFTQFNIQVYAISKMLVFDIQPQASQWQSVWAQRTIKILPYEGLAKASHSTLDSSFYHVNGAVCHSFSIYPTPDPT